MNRLSFNTQSISLNSCQEQSEIIHKIIVVEISGSYGSVLDIIIERNSLFCCFFYEQVGSLSIAIICCPIQSTLEVICEALFKFNEPFGNDDLLSIHCSKQRILPITITCSEPNQFLYKGKESIITTFVEGCIKIRLRPPCHPGFYIDLTRITLSLCNLREESERNRLRLV